MELSWADRLVFKRVSRNGTVLGRSPSISLLPKVTRVGQPMDTFRQLGAPTPISLNDGLSFNNNNNIIIIIIINYKIV